MNYCFPLFTYDETFPIALKNGDVESQRVRGKQNSLGDIFSSAWSKGVDDRKVCSMLRIYSNSNLSVKHLLRRVLSR